MYTHITGGTIPRCPCGGLVKPDITFFGESLPPTFHDNLPHASNADLAIIMGSSLSVYPFAALPGRCGERCARLLINMEAAGGIGTRRDDVLMLGTCDDGVKRLAKELGWEVELDNLYKELQGPEEKEEAMSDAMIEEEIKRLTAELDKELKIAEDYKGLVEGKLKREDEKRNEIELNRKVKEDLEGKIPEGGKTEDGEGGLENGAPCLSLKSGV